MRGLTLAQREALMSPEARVQRYAHNAVHAAISAAIKDKVGPFADLEFGEQYVDDRFEVLGLDGEVVGHFDTWELAKVMARFHEEHTKREAGTR